MKRAALQGDPKAQYNLGRSYLAGEELAKNVKAAKWWLGKAARQGHSLARTLLRAVRKNKRH
jgi:TPR repeat protein